MRRAAAAVVSAAADVASSSLRRRRDVHVEQRRGFAAAAAAAADAAVSLLELTRLERPTKREFLAFRAANPEVPCVMRGAVADLGWKLSEWSPKDLRDKFGDVEVPLEVGCC